jgi:hypothetical protein
MLGVQAPGVVADGAPFGDLSLASPGVVAPSFRLSVHTTPDATMAASQGPGQGTLAWTYGRAEGCPVRLVLVGTVAVRPCLLLDVGALSVDGHGEAHALSPVRAWVAAGGLARVDWALPLGGRWDLVLEAQGGVTFPMARQSFEFQPSAFVYQAPPAAGLAGIGGGVRFP